MKGIVPLFLGIFGTFAFSWAGLILIPNYQIGHLEPQMDEDGNDPYPSPKSGMADRGRQIYAANGCVYCHSQQVRADYAASDIDRKWGDRRSAPRDYLFERPVVLGKMRLGPDLSNIGKRAPAEEENASPAASPTPAGPAAPQTSPAASAAPGASPPAPAAASASPAASPAAASPSPAPPAASPSPAANAATTVVTTTAPTDKPAPYSAAWHHRHLYSPRSLVLDSNMPAYRFLYEERRIGGARAADALTLGEADAVPEGWEVVPNYDAKCLVAYLMSLDQSHALNELKATAAASSPAPAPSPATPAASPAPALAKEAK
ncbi:MAG TPA: cbb3-type cytochrome c oxidase subunit II [Chthoniobacterales bacterium]|nr:cbb3-type cytochrome c oxidase subunit II [Chthoniobacterales bacterium]